MEMPVPSKISELVRRFEDNYVSYKSTQYEEKQLQNDFINDFFAALGWDMGNTRGWAENVKEVILEDRVRFG
ncbi:MAG: type IV restriction endonuclease, partial [bacterium]